MKKGILSILLLCLFAVPGKSASLTPAQLSARQCIDSLRTVIESYTVLSLWRDSVSLQNVKGKSDYLLKAHKGNILRVNRSRIGRQRTDTLWSSKTIKVKSLGFMVGPDNESDDSLQATLFITIIYESGGKSASVTTRAKVYSSRMLMRYRRTGEDDFAPLAPEEFLSNQAPYIEQAPIPPPPPPAPPPAVIHPIPDQPGIESTADEQEIVPPVPPPPPPEPPEPEVIMPEEIESDE